MRFIPRRLLLALIIGISHIYETGAHEIKFLGDIQEKPISSYLRLGHFDKLSAGSKTRHNPESIPLYAEFSPESLDLILNSSGDDVSDESSDEKSNQLSEVELGQIIVMRSLTM